MAKNPDAPKRGGKSAKSKAGRPDVQPIGPALADLLNPAINRGEAGVGSQTGRRVPETRLQPPADNSRDRRNDFAEAHKARILEALGLHTTADLVQYAIRNGIISV